MEGFARWVVRRRKLVLVLAVVLLVPSVLGALATRINYDILTYLPPELDSMIGETYLEEDFKTASTAMITVEHMTPSAVTGLKKQISAVQGVSTVLDAVDLLDAGMPADMLPEALQKFFYGANDATLMIVKFDGTSASKETMAAVRQIKGILGEAQFIGGMSAILEDTKALVNQEMPLYILCAVGCSLLVLFLSLEETVVPLIFMLGIAFPIVYNFGTNIFLGQISYITQALATVLQLGVTMDFSIFLLHRYEEEKQRLCAAKGEPAGPQQAEQAMVKAICNTASSIAGSSLTTIAGFLAMCTMSLTLGSDIGIVMAKGVALGVICTVVILPHLHSQTWPHRTVCNKAVRGHTGCICASACAFWRGAKQNGRILHAVRFASAGYDGYCGDKPPEGRPQHDHHALYYGGRFPAWRTDEGNVARTCPSGRRDAGAEL